MNTGEEGVLTHLVTLDISQLTGIVGDANEPYRQILARADLIFAEDKATGRRILFFGNELVEDISRGRQSEFDEKNGIIVQLDLSPDCPQPEFLVAAIEVLKVKGSCCYRSK